MKKTLLFFLSLCMILTFANLRVNTASALENNIITDMESDVSAETSVIGNYAEIPPTQFGTIENGEIIWKESGSAGEAELMSTTSFICDTYSLLVSETASLLTDTIPSGTTVTWSSQNTDIATVSSSGVVTGVKAGTARINASVNDGTSTVVKQVSVYVIIENGVYYIKNNATSKYLHVNNSSIAENAGLVVSTKLTSHPARLAQLWKINYLGEGCYSIRPMHKLDMCLQRYGLGVAIGTRGTTENVSDLSGLAQWRISGVSSGYKLDSRSYTGNYLYVNGTAVSLGGTSNNVWSLEKLSSAPSGVLLYNTQSWIAPESTVQFVAAVYSGSTLNQGVTWTSSNTDVATVYSSGVVIGVAAGTAVITAKSTYNTSWSKTFTVNIGNIPNGTYFIKNKETNQLLDITSASIDENATICQKYFSGENFQNWIFELQQDGFYTIKSEYSSLYLSVLNNSSVQNATVVQLNGGTATGQRWSLTKLSDGSYKISAKCGMENNTCLAVNSLTNGAQAKHNVYSNDSDYKDEWFVTDNYDFTHISISDAGHDHDSIYTTVSGYTNSIGYSIKRLVIDIDKNECVNMLETSKIVCIRSHGLKDCIEVNEGELFSIYLLNQFPANKFENCKLVLYGACLTGEGGEGANNLVNKTHEKGALVVIGFKEPVDCQELNIWIQAFFSAISNGQTVNNACIAAKSVIMNTWDYSITTDSYYIAGDRDYILSSE